MLGGHAGAPGLQGPSGGRVPDRVIDNVVNCIVNHVVVRIQHGIVVGRRVSIAGATVKAPVDALAVVGAAGVHAGAVPVRRRLV
jgi:hypothetical protein